MATTTIPRVFILLTIISTLFMSPQARVVRGDKVVMQKNIDSEELFHDLGFDLSKLANFQRRSLAESYVDKVVPGGPDGQHHL
ncbi:hypothetical protein SLA2020_268480 [Shorea laevis]